MADSKLTDLTPITLPSATDLMYIVTGVGSTPTDNSIAFSDVEAAARASNMQAVATASATVANSSSAATIIGTVSGSLTLAANALSAGKSLHIRAMGVVSTTGTPNLTLLVKIGSVTIATTGAVATGSGLANALWIVDVWVTCRTAGVSGTVFAQGQATVAGVLESMANTAAVTVNTTTTEAIDITAQFSAADPANTISGTNIYIEKVN